MSNPFRPTQHDSPMFYRITVKGQLDPAWAEWFDGMTILPTRHEDGTVITVLTGPVVDQVALHGLLARIRDLCLLLLQVQCLEEPACTGHTSHRNR